MIIDIEKAIVSILNYDSEKMSHQERLFRNELTSVIKRALTDQGLRIKNGEIISINEMRQYALEHPLVGVFDYPDKDVPETDFGKLNEFEQCLKSGTNIYLEQGRRMEDWDAREDAKELLAIARKENTIKWSEEDDEMLYGCIETEEYMLSVVDGKQQFDVGNEQIKAQCQKELDWLKSLRPQKQWKPSEEQIEALDFAIDCTIYPEFQNKRKVLKELLEQLKAL